MSNVAIFAVICNIFHNIKYQTAVMAPLDFYFEKKMHAELPWWQRHCALPFEKVERLSQVIWHDVGMHTVLSYTGMEV